MSFTIDKKSNLCYPKNRRFNMKFSIEAKKRLEEAWKNSEEIQLRG